MAAPDTPPRRPAKRNTATAGAASAVTPPAPPRHRDPAIERALQLSTFESNYSTEDFITTLSDKLISESKATPGAFDPKPFLQTFSPALDTLLSLRIQVAERTKKMETDVRRAEREYGRRLRELDGGFEAIGSSFSSLESKITDVGRTAVRIGEQLESLHQTRSTAQSTSLILSYYLALAHHTSTTPDPNNAAAAAHPLETLFATRTSREGRARLAIVLRRLMAVSKDIADNAATAVSEAEAAATPKDILPRDGPNGSGGRSGTQDSAEGKVRKDGEPDQDLVVSAKLVVRRRKEKEKAERVRDEVEQYCEKFEKEVLRLFDRSYRKGDPRMMAHCARTLQDFNGGASCVQIYVNQHDFFISKDKVLEEASQLNGESGQVDIWKTIGDPDAPAPTSEPGMDALFKEIRTTVSQEAQIVKAVFPSPFAVMEVFLQRVFAQVIQQHLESLVERATAISTLAVLRILHLTHAACASLIDDLKQYDASLSTPGSSSAGSSKGPGAGGATTGGPLAAMLDHALEEMFVPWLEGTRYLESESKNLVELYGGLLSRFTRYHETVQKAKPNSLLDKVVHQISSSGSHTTQSTAQSAAAAISKYANLFTSSAAAATTAAKQAVQQGGGNGSGTGTGTVTSPTTGSKPHLPGHLAVPRADGGRSGAMTPTGNRGLQRSDSFRGEAVNKSLEDKVWATDGILTVEMAERMLKWHAEAVGRVMELSGSGDVGNNAFALSKVLAEALGRSYIETALDSALTRLDNQDAKLDPDLQPLTVLKPADLICHLWQRYSSTALLPLASAPTLRKEMSTFGQHNIVRMEGKINRVIQKALDNIVNWLKQLLTKQKKHDYKPANDEISFARNTTEPCQLSCEFLETVRETMRESLSGKNAEAFLTEVGVAFHSLLLDHYKKFPVNPTGGLMLTKDLASYQETVGTFGISAVNDRFDMLRQLGNSFIVQPNVLKSYMTESHLGRIDARLLRPYLAQRSDYSQFSRSLQLEEGPIPAEEHQNMIGMWKSGHRLSAMSGVAGAGMGKLKAVLKDFEVGPEDADRARRARLAATSGSARQGAGGAGAGPGGQWQTMPVYFGI